MPEFLIPLATFAFVTSITPGPNNVMLMASGANFGFRRTLPHMTGVGIGFVVMAFLTGIGLAGVFDTWPELRRVLAAVSVGYVVWLAWKIAHAAAPGQHMSTGAPLTFLQAALFQWVNPKAWAMALTAVTIHAPDQTMEAVLAVALVFGAVNLPSISVWCLMGREIGRWLTDRRRLLVFNWVMAGLLVSSMAPVIL